MNLVEIAKLYDKPAEALQILQKAQADEHYYLKTESAFERFLGLELKARAARVENGRPSPVSILENTLDTSPTVGGVAGFHSGFNLIRWQENDGVVE